MTLEQTLRITFCETSNLSTSRKEQDLPKGKKSFFFVEQNLFCAESFGIRDDLQSKSTQRSFEK